MLCKEHRRKGWTLGLRQLCRTKSSAFAVGLRNVTPTTKARQVPSNMKSMLTVFDRGRNSSWICTSWPDGEQGVLSEHEKAEIGSEEKKAWFMVGKKWSLHPDNTQAYAYLLVRYFLKHETTLVPSLRTRQTLHQRTSFSSPSWNPRWKDDDWSLSKRWKKIHCQRYADFKRGIPGMLRKLEETLRAMYKGGRENFEGDTAQ